MYLTKEQKEKIRIVAFDLDGTLLDDESHISPYTRNVLEDAAAKGYHIVPATGRTYTALPKDLMTIRGWDYAITSNGAQIRRMKDNALIFESYIKWSDVEAVMDALLDERVICDVFFNGRGYIAEKSLLVLDQFLPEPVRQEYVRTTRTPAEDLEMLIREHKNELENIMLRFCDPMIMEQYFEFLNSRPGLAAVYSQKDALDIGGSETSKANALRELARLHDLTTDNIISFGDSLNDLAMLKASGVSVAMGNASEPLKEAADIIAPPNRDDGLARVVAELLD